jgi:hypothetical protein
MSSTSMSVHPPYATPFPALPRDAADASRETFAAPMRLRVPYVPPDARVAAATAVLDAPEAAALVPGARLDTPLHVPAVVAEPETLPSIDQFLLEPTADDGAATMAALFAATEPEGELEAEAIDHHDVSASAGPTTSEGDEPWAIAEASEELAELADGLIGRTSTVETASDAEASSMEPWTDDERWMDIMPALQTPGGPDLAGETAWARAFSEPPAPLTPAPLPAGDTEAAAASLEAIARRLRAGELDVPGYRGERGDAAALAAALAALLGARS